MESAFRDANRQEIDGYAIIVDKEHERLMPGWVPRRLGWLIIQLIDLLIDQVVA
jgi:hypothetical protein